MISFPGRGICQRAMRRGMIEASRAASRFRSYDLAIFHEFAPPPAGGGHQFLRALKEAWARRDLRVEVNSISRTTRACLFNSYNFDPPRLRRLRRMGCRLVHRVDGPLSVYRGFDDGSDAKIVAWNREFADATILQSTFSLNAHANLGLVFANPVVIPNAADPGIFYPPASPVQEKDLRQRKVRIISASWSDNPNKGSDIYQWLDQHLDFSRYEYTFAGRIGVELRNIRVVPPLPSNELAALLREHDLFLTASQHDPCSNSVIEAMACGLPVVYRNSGGHPELVGNGGIGFDSPAQIPAMLEPLISNYEHRRTQIPQRDIRDICEAYLRVLL